MSSTITTTSPARSATRPTPLVQGIRVLLAAFGALKLYGTAYFTFLATRRRAVTRRGRSTGWSPCGRRPSPWHWSSRPSDWGAGTGGSCA